MSSITRANALYLGPYPDNYNIQPAAILTMSSEDIKNLNNDPLVEIHVSVDDKSFGRRPISRGKLSLVALNAAMLGVSVHWIWTSRNALKDIKYVVLPPGSSEAYNYILKWIKLVIDSGQIEPFPVITTMPIWRYKCLMEAAWGVRMEYLENDLHRRMKRLLRVTPGEDFALDMLDVLQVIDGSDHDDPVRIQMVSAIRKAKKQDFFSGNFKKEYKEFLERYPDCGLESTEDE